MQRAHVQSIQSIRDFRGDLQQFQDEIRHGLDLLLTQLIRVVEYFESNRSTYWPTQVRKASDRLAQARAELECCLAGLSLGDAPGDRPSCYDQKKALQAAKERLELAEQKVRLTRKWRTEVLRQVDEFRTTLAQIQYATDSEIPRALALLDRLADRLERYVDANSLRPES